jgi:hypothetical protein
LRWCARSASDAFTSLRCCSDFHEAFVDISSGLDDRRSITLRLGEQELVYGTGRLVDNNEGVNVKSSFYGARIIAHTETLRLEVFGVKPTEQNTGTFDDRPSSQQMFWGAYATVPLRLLDQAGQADLYYLGIDTTRAVYQQGSGREIRHSIGTRWFNHIAGAPFEPGFDYNWELVYQLGTFAQNYINAWTVADRNGLYLPGTIHAQGRSARRCCKWWAASEWRHAEHL